MRHLLFFDGECPLCHRAVRFVLQEDKKEKFLFAPLQGVTAREKLGYIPPLDTLILVENFSSSRELVLIEGKAVLRILWHLGRRWSLWGLLSFLPAALFGGLYRYIARRRYHFFKQDSAWKTTIPSERLLG